MFFLFELVMEIVVLSGFGFCLLWLGLGLLLLGLLVGGQWIEVVLLAFVCFLLLLGLFVKGFWLFRAFVIFGEAEHLIETHFVNIFECIR
jgi:hypothetical protein